MEDKIIISKEDIESVDARETVNLGDFLSELKNAKLIRATYVEKKFGMGHNTFSRLCEKDLTITAETKNKMGLIIAYQLNKFEEDYDNNLKALEDDDKMEKNRKKYKIEELNTQKERCSEYIEKFKKVFGSKAEYCFKRVREDDKFKS